MACQNYCRNDKATPAKPDIFYLLLQWLIIASCSAINMYTVKHEFLCTYLKMQLGDKKFPQCTHRSWDLHIQSKHKDHEEKFSVVSWWLYVYCTLLQLRQMQYHNCLHQLTSKLRWKQNKTKQKQMHVNDPKILCHSITSVSLK